LIDGTQIMSDIPKAATPEAPAPLYGVLAEYDDPTTLARAARKVRDAGYTRWDTYTPFPIHGMDKAMGIRMTKLPWIVLVAALIGMTVGTVFQYWTNAVNYRWLVSGKPFWSWPANVPIIFEMTILFSAFAALGGMLVLNNLPLPAHPLDLKERFRRVTDDKFFLFILVRDPKFDEKETRELLAATSPSVLDDVHEDRGSSDQVPKGLIYALLIAGAASLVPFALFAKARESKMSHGRIHVVWDMDFTPSYKPQSGNPLFDDQRGMRLPPAGSVPVDHLRVDDHLYQGKVGPAFASTLPLGIVADESTMKLGKAQFGIYCAPCHGQSGEGNGPINQRAETLKQGWVPPSNLHQQYLRDQPAGEIFRTITHGIRNMSGYASQIDPEERWAIVLYVRALQKSRTAQVSDLTDAERAQLK